MPIIRVLLLSGHPPGVKTRLANLLTDAYRMVIPAPHEAITIALQEIDNDNYMRGGAKRRRAEAPADPVSVIKAYDEAFAKGDFEAARKHLTDDFFYMVPGNVRLEGPSEAAEWLANRSAVFDITERVLETAFGDRGPIIYMRCKMSGKRRNGDAYENLRVALRFEFVQGKIASIEMWSDFAPPPAAPTPEV